MLLVAAVGAWRIVAVSRIQDRGVFVKYPALADALLAGEDISDRIGDVSQAYLAVIVVARGPLGLSHHQIVSIQVGGVALLAALLSGVCFVRWGSAAAIAAAAVTLGNRGALVNATELEPETLLVLLTGGGVAAAVLGADLRWRALSGVLIGAAAATRPTVLLPAVVFFAGLIWSDRRGRLPWVLGAGAAAIGLVATVLTARLLVAQLPGATTPMNPGTVFFEGWNADATGYQGEAPAVVKDVEHRLGVPDGLHPAYRRVTALALDREDPGASNVYWWQRSVAFISRHPQATLRLAARKAANVIHAHEAWDLATLERRSRLTRGWLLLPFSMLLAGATLGSIWGRRDPIALPLTLWLIGSLAVPVLFYVTSRQRNLTLPALVFLTALAVEEVHRRWRISPRTVGGAAAALVGGLALAVPGPAQIEDRHAWDLEFAREAALAEADVARRRGDEKAANRADIRAVLALARDHTTAEAGLKAAWQAEASSAPSAPRRFDLAVVAVDRGWHRRAEALLASLADEGYHPSRGARVTSSVAYQRARCAVIRKDLAAARRHLEVARAERPGSPRILALDALVAERSGDDARAAFSRTALRDLHDPATVDLADADALDTFGAPEPAHRLRAAVWVRLMPG
jgi:hypothetical protein